MWFFYSTQDSQPRDSDNDSLSWMPTHDPYIEEACDTDGERVADDNLRWRWVPNSRDTQGFLPGAAGVDPALYPDLVSNSIRVIVGQHRSQCRVRVFLAARQLVVNVVQPESMCSYITAAAVCSFLMHARFATEGLGQRLALLDADP